MDRLLDRERPALVVGTGGYASGPVVWRAARRGIPTAIQEQNAYPGLATRRLAKRVREIWLGVPEARRTSHRAGAPTVLDTGNPITPPDPLDGAPRPATGSDSIPRRPVLLVTGGSQGALAINEAVATWLDSGGADGHADPLGAGRRPPTRGFADRAAPPTVQVFDFLDPDGRRLRGGRLSPSPAPG